MCVLCFCGRSVLYCGRQPKQVIKSDLEEISPDCLSIIHPSKKDVCVHRGWWTRVACPGLCSCPAQMRCFGSGRRCSWWSVCGCAEEGLLSGTAGSPLAAESSGVYSPHLGSGPQACHFTCRPLVCAGRPWAPGRAGGHRLPELGQLWRFSAVPCRFAACRRGHHPRACGAFSHLLLLLGPWR